jgi:hypothetical protein
MLHKTRLSHWRSSIFQCAFPYLYMGLIELRSGPQDSRVASTDLRFIDRLPQRKFLNSANKKREPGSQHQIPAKKSSNKD